MSFWFGDFELDRERRQLLRSGESVPLEPKAYELLSLLLECRPRALSRAQIRYVVWPQTFVSESTLAVAVNGIRQALGDDPRHPRFIGTGHGFGYAFCGEAREGSEAESILPAPTEGAAARGASGDQSRLQDVDGVDLGGIGPAQAPGVTAGANLDREGLATGRRQHLGVREAVAIEIRAHSLAWGLGWADAAEIDTINILQATLLAMRRALVALNTVPAHVIVDGNRVPSLAGLDLDCSIEAVVEGDALVPSVSAASILAKCVRDAHMVELDAQYPGYGFAGHKGYPTAAHVAALRQLGPSPVHRRSFAPPTFSPPAA